MTGWHVHAWALMGDHYHLFIETPEPNLVAGMAWLQNTLTRRYNVRYPVRIWQVLRYCFAHGFILVYNDNRLPSEAQAPVICPASEALAEDHLSGHSTSEFAASRKAFERPCNVSSTHSFDVTPVVKHAHITQ
ncbi:hypothetical protein [Prosthecobacter sp.]|uniref:hypothetical protein n=1 Tax=Prosthecobacter sp. TaxID=1965333 RepID=UPI00378443D6